MRIESGVIMNRSFCARLLGTAAFFLALQTFTTAMLRATELPASSGANHPISAATLEHIAQLPLAFEENLGQAQADTRFIARATGYQVHVSSDVVAISIANRQAKSTSILRVRLVGARSDAPGTGLDRLSASTNYFLGGGAVEQFTDVPNYSRVKFDDVYPGVGVVYYGNQRNLEYDIVLQPGVDPAAICLALDGADHIRVDKNGNLLLSVGSESMQLKIPVVYQEYNGKRRPISASFKLLANNQIGIRTASYDRTRALTIDPTLVYASYLGGSKDDHGRSIAVDGAGNAYIVGYTQSTDFPVLSAYQSTPGRLPQLAFVTKVNPTGTALIYSTYLGDTKAINNGYAIAVDAAGDAYIAGTTTSTAFPTTTGAYQRTSAGGSNNSFVVKLGPAGNALLYGSYVTNATATAIALDSSNSVYVTGNATSTFATSTGAYQTTTHASSGVNAFVIKLNLQTTPAAYSTFLGGSTNDYGSSIAVDSSGNAYIGGYAGSTDFPTTSGAFQTAAQGLDDGFVTKLNPQGNSLVYSTRLGGNDGDAIFGIAVDAAGSAYVTGFTASFNFPITANAFQRTKGGAGYSIFCLFCKINFTQFPNAFVTKLSPDGRSQVYSSFLGGNGSATGQDSYGDWGEAIAVDASGHAFVAGLIGSTTGFPLLSDLKPRQPENSKGLFVAKVSGMGDALLYSTHAGWQSDSEGYGIAVDSKGDAYAVTSAENTASTDSFLISSGAYKTTPPASLTYDAIFLKLTTGAQPTVTLSPSAKSITIGQTLTASISVSGSITGSVLLYDGSIALMTVPLSNGVATANLNLPAGLHGLTAVYRNNGAEGISSTMYVAVNQPATCN